MSEWISVKDALPEDDCYVLAYYACPVHNHKTGETEIWHKRFVGWYEAEWDSWTDGEFYQLPVTHWMNLPYPPEVNP